MGDDTGGFIVDVRVWYYPEWRSRFVCSFVWRYTLSPKRQILENLYLSEIVSEYFFYFCWTKSYEYIELFRLHLPNVSTWSYKKHCFMGSHTSWKTWNFVFSCKTSKSYGNSPSAWNFTLCPGILVSALEFSAFMKISDLMVCFCRGIFSDTFFCLLFFVKVVY